MRQKTAKEEENGMKTFEKVAAQLSSSKRGSLGALFRGHRPCLLSSSSCLFLCSKRSFFRAIWCRSCSSDASESVTSSPPVFGPSSASDALSLEASPYAIRPAEGEHEGWIKTSPKARGFRTWDKGASLLSSLQPAGSKLNDDRDKTLQGRGKVTFQNS